MTNYKSELIDVLNIMEELIDKIGTDPTVEKVDIMQVLDTLYDKLDNCRVEIDEEITSLRQELSEENGGCYGY